jgi:integrase
MHLEEYIDFLTERLRWEGTERVSGATLAASTVKKYLRVLSKLFRRAWAAQVISGKHRPFDDIMNMHEVEEEEAEWLDGRTAALLLAAARLYRPKRAELALPCAYTIVAVLLLTGMRPAEGLGLYIENIDFDRPPGRHRGAGCHGAASARRTVAGVAHQRSVAATFSSAQISRRASPMVNA